MSTSGPHPEATALTTEEARAARTERELRLLADPGRAVELNRALLAAGGEEAERYFRAGFEIAYAAFSRRDWEVNTVVLDRDDYVFRFGAAQGGPIDFPSDFEGVAGYLEAQLAMLEVWADVRVELDAVQIHPPDRVVTTMVWRGTASASGVPMVWRGVGDNRFRDGLGVSQTFWHDRDRAERELGFALPGSARR